MLVRGNGLGSSMQAALKDGDRSAEPPPLRRRISTVAFADIVGYAVLTAADETGTHERWLALFRRHVSPSAARFGGRIVGDLRGDGVLAEFAEPAAALAWAGALHAAAAAAVEAEPDHQPITFRVAIHRGSVLAGAEGLFGDAVNLASRLQEYGTPGGTLLSAEALALLPPAVQAAARDLGDLPMRNLARPVRAYALDGDGAVPVPLSPPPPRLPSVAVLPLLNVTGDPADDYLAEGVVEDVIASLAGLHEVFVIARDSARMFAGRTPSPQRVGRTLGVRFVVTGSMRRTERGATVSVQLAESETGTTLWGDRFEVGREDIFALQEHVVGRIVAGIAPNIRAASLREAMRKRPENLTAYDLTLRGLHVLGTFDRDTFARGRAFLDQAMAEDPDFAMPIAWAARWHSLNIGQGWSSDPRADADAACALAARAIECEPGNALALSTLGHISAYIRRDWDTALDCFAQAVEASPGSAIAWTLSSCTLSYVGRGEDALRHVERGIRLSPYDPLRFSQRHFLAFAHYVTGDLAEAERASRVSIGIKPDHASNWIMMATTLAAAGREEEAREAGRRVLALRPGLRLGPYVRDQLAIRDPALRERFVAGLRMAGLPD